MSDKQLPWLRLYTEIIDDEKLGLLAFEDRWHYVALLCIKGKGILDGGDDAELLHRKVAFKLGLTCAELEKVAARLAGMGLIDAQTFQPLAWDDRQQLSDRDPTNAERQARYRERKKAEKTRNVTVTVLDTDTDTDKETHTTGAGAREAVAGVCVEISEKPENPENPPPESADLPGPDAELVTQLQLAGISDAHCGSPLLLGLIGKGVAHSAFTAAADVARRKNRTDFAYVLGIVRRQATESVHLASVPACTDPPWDDSRSSIESEGMRLGLGRWCADPTQELFSAYTQRVRAARSAPNRRAA